MSGADPIFEVSREPYNYIHLFYHCIKLVVDLFDDIKLVVMNVCVCSSWICLFYPIQLSFFLQLYWESYTLLIMYIISLKLEMMLNEYYIEYIPLHDFQMPMSFYIFHISNKDGAILFLMRSLSQLKLDIFDLLFNNTSC